MIIAIISVVAAACGSVNVKTQNNAESNSVIDVGHPADTSVEPLPIVPVKIDVPLDEKFDAAGIPKGWKWIDPDIAKGPVRYDTSGGTLRIIVPSGKDMSADNVSAPRMLRAIEGDFQIETRVNFDPKRDYQGAGFLVFKDNANYLRFERAFGGSGGGGNGIRLSTRTKGTYQAIATPKTVGTDAKTVDLKLLRKGTKFIAFWRLDGEADWKQVGEYDSDYSDVVQVGILACNTDAEIPVEFSNIKLAPVK